MSNEKSAWVGDIPFFVERPNVFLVSSLVKEVSRLSKWDRKVEKNISKEALNAIRNGELKTTYPYETSDPHKTTIIPFVHIQEFGVWMRRTNPELKFIPPMPERTRKRGQIEKDNDDLIIAALYFLGYNPLNLVAGTGRTHGPKFQVKDALKVDHVGARMSLSAFDKAWNRLKRSKRVIQTTPLKAK